MKGNLAHSNAFKNGLLTIQDESSMIVALALGVSENDHVLDACAAPGGKSTHIAEKLNGTGEVIPSTYMNIRLNLYVKTHQTWLSNIQTKALDSQQCTRLF